MISLALASAIFFGVISAILCIALWFALGRSAKVIADKQEDETATRNKAAIEMLPPFNRWLRDRTTKELEAIVAGVPPERFGWNEQDSDRSLH